MKERGKLRVTGWKSGREGGVFGLRVGRQNAKQFFDKKWRFVELDFDNRRVQINVTRGFWAGCPELRDPFVKVFLERNKLVPWPKGRPPRIELTPRGGNRFSVSLE
jgi:hypothetical protein